jgi:7-cyano-7-deazaguanine synthase
MTAETPSPLPVGERSENGEGALVLFSGGQDSTTCLMWALARYKRVETVGFSYGQRHAVELSCRERIRARLAAWPGWGERLGPDHLLDLGALFAAGVPTSLTADLPLTQPAGGLPSTFVPGRNLLFFMGAAIIAFRRGLRRLVGGMCETDFSGYPDCRDDTLKALQVALNLGMERRFVIETPLMWRDKADTFALAEELGGEAGLALILEETHTCYLGERGMRHPWGYGCGTCPACSLRARGFALWEARRGGAGGAPTA